MPSRACQGLSRAAGAHFRADFPDPADPAHARFTCAKLKGGQIEVATEPVAFSRVRPRESLLEVKKSAGG
ncbi:MAG: hypothetical protein AAB223_00540 [Pseudomonadota bacterium]